MSRPALRRGSVPLSHTHHPRSAPLTIPAACLTVWVHCVQIAASSFANIHVSAYNMFGANTGLRGGVISANCRRGGGDRSVPGSATVNITATTFRSLRVDSTGDFGGGIICASQNSHVTLSAVEFADVDSGILKSQGGGLNDMAGGVVHVYDSASFCCVGSHFLRINVHGAFGLTGGIIYVGANNDALHPKGNGYGQLKYSVP